MCYGSNVSTICRDLKITIFKQFEKTFLKKKKNVISLFSGDSGGPIIYESINGTIQVGIVSFNLFCEIGIPSGFVNVYIFRNWIEGAVECLKCDHNTSDNYTKA